MCVFVFICIFCIYIRSLDPPPTVSLAEYTCSYKSCLVYIPVIVSLFGLPIA